jgi:predicted ABC-type ATPase
MKDVVIIGGPNGAGKSTVAATLLPQHLKIREFVNADEIAKGISPFNPSGNAIAAGRLMIGRMRYLQNAGESFAFETTLAGRAYLRMLQNCHSAGYRITLIFLWLPTVESALKRVAKRVAEGGHDVPPETVTRRFYEGLRNLHDIYLPIADMAFIYDNSDDAGGILFAEKRRKRDLKILDHARWRALEAQIQ